MLQRLCPSVLSKVTTLSLVGQLLQPVWVRASRMTSKVGWTAMSAQLLTNIGPLQPRPTEIKHILNFFSVSAPTECRNLSHWNLAYCNSLSTSRFPSPIDANMYGAPHISRENLLEPHSSGWGITQKIKTNDPDIQLIISTLVQNV